MVRSTRGFRLDNDASRLHRQRNLARAGDMHAANVLRLRECFVDVATFFRRDVADVAVQLLPRQRRAGLESLLGVDHRWQRFVFHFDGVGSVLGNSAALRDDGRHGHADFMHRAARQNRMGRDLLPGDHRRHRYHQFDIGASQYGDDAGHCLRRAGVDGNNFCVRICRTQES